MRYLFTAIAFAVVVSATARGQASPPAAEPNPELIAAGRRAGESAARELSTPSVLIGSFIGGVITGAGALGVASDGKKSAVPLIVTGVGVAIVATSISASRDRARIIVPDRIRRSIETRPPEYQAAFIDAWVDQLRRERQASALLGSGSGVAGGILLAAVLLRALEGY